MNRILGLVFVSAALVAGCGGGSGFTGDGDPTGPTQGPPPPAPPPPTPPPPIPPPPAPPPAAFSISPQNAETVGAVAYAAASGSAEIAGLAGSSGLVAAGPQDASKTIVPGELSKPLTRAVLSVPIGPETEPCLLAGSVTISGDLANPLTLTAGDTITVESQGCSDVEGEIVDGTLSFVVDAMDGDILTGLYDLTMTLSTTDMQITTPDDVVSSSGSVTVNLDTLASPAVAVSVSGASFRTDSNSSSETLSDFLTAQTANAGVSPSPYTLDSSGTLDSTALPGVVDYSTPVVLQGTLDGYPTNGEFLVEAADGTSARLVAQSDGMTVVIEIDSNADGNIDDTIVTTWAELDSPQANSN